MSNEQIEALVARVSKAPLDNDGLSALMELALLAEVVVSDWKILAFECERAGINVSDLLTMHDDG